MGDGSGRLRKIFRNFEGGESRSPSIRGIICCQISLILVEN